MKAVGAYVKGAREGLGLNRAQVAARISDQLSTSIDQTTIWRIETAAMTPRFDMFLALLMVVRGKVEDVWELMNQAGVSPAEAEERGRRAVGALRPAPALTPDEADELRRLAAAATPEARARALTALQRLLEE